MLDAAFRFVAHEQSVAANFCFACIFVDAWQPRLVSVGFGSDLGLRFAVAGEEALKDCRALEGGTLGVACSREALATLVLKADAEAGASLTLCSSTL